MQAFNGLPVQDSSGGLIGFVHDAWVDDQNRIIRVRLQVADHLSRRPACAEVSQISVMPSSGVVVLPIASTRITQQLRG
jgi:hypothetical protein